MRLMLHKDSVIPFINGINNREEKIKVIVGTHKNSDCVGIGYIRNGRFYSHLGISDNIITKFNNVKIVELLPIEYKVEILLFEAILTKGEILDEVSHGEIPYGFIMGDDIITIKYDK